MTGKDAAMFPIIASCTLFGIYIIFQVSIKHLVCIIACNAFIVLVHLSKLYRDNLLKTFFFFFFFPHFYRQYRQYNTFTSTQQDIKTRL